MSDLIRAAIGLFAVMATLGAGTTLASLASDQLPARRRLLAVAALLAFAGLAVVAAVSSEILEWLAVSPENFQLAAGLVMLPLAFRLLWAGSVWPPQLASTTWRVWSLLSGPVPAVLVLSYSARFGFETALGAAAIALAASATILLAGAWFAGRFGAVQEMLGRFNGVLIIALAIELMLDGVQSV
ncbi:MAG TPA: MarC family protein [Dehalococcoidia bacterium]|nr:MarC family protein [Dehalococcoidia bacterium]